MVAAATAAVARRGLRPPWGPTAAATSRAPPAACRRTLAAVASATLSGRSAEPSGAAGAAALLRGGLAVGDGPVVGTSNAVIQQGNTVFARLRVSRQSTSSQLVEALQQLTAIGRNASSSDRQALVEHPGFAPLLEELTRQLPRDAGEQVAWERPWTSQVITALNMLRPPESVDSRLFLRLGHTLAQAAEKAPESELEALLHSVCDLCVADGRGLAPDDYTLWVLGRRLEGLCAAAPIGSLDAAYLVRLLHLFAHPAIRNRIAGRGSPVVLRHVHHGLNGYSPGTIAKLLQAYSDVPNLVADALGVLAQRPAQEFLALPLPEVAAIATAFPERRGGVTSTPDVGAGIGAGAHSAAAALAPVILQRLRAALAPAGGTAAGGTAAESEPAARMEFVLLSASRAIEHLQLDGEKDSDGVRELLGALTGVSGKDAAQPLVAPAALSALPADAVARLILLALSVDARLPKDGLATAAASARLRQAWEALVPRLAELSTPRLAELAAALGALGESSPKVPVPVLETVQTVAASRAHAMSDDEFGQIARSLASAGLLDKSFFDAFDVEACLARAPPVPFLADIVWSMAAVGLERSTAWVLAASALEAHRGAPELAGEPGVLLFEALNAHRVVASAAPAAASTPWPPPESAAADLCADESVAAAWRERRALVAPPSANGDAVAGILQELGYAFDRDVEGSDGLYVKPFVLREAGDIILDLTGASTQHPASRLPRGQVLLRHRVWTSSGRSALAISDAMWRQIAQKAAAADGSPEDKAAAVAKRQQTWLREKVEALHREDLAREIDLPEETAAELEGLPFGPGGLNADALRRLKEQPATVRQRSIAKFRMSWENPKVDLRKPSGFMIRVIEKEVAAYVKEQEKSRKESRMLEQQEQLKKEGRSAVDAATARPAGGWTHDAGKPLEEAKAGEKISGKVTNILHGRVWVDAGFAKDVSFKSASADKLFNVGEELKNLEVIGMNEKKSFLEVKTPAPDMRKRAEMRRQRAAAAKPAEAVPRRGAPAAGAALRGSSAGGARVATGGDADKGKADKGKADKGKADKGKADKGKDDKGKADAGKAAAVGGGRRSRPTVVSAGAGAASVIRKTSDAARERPATGWSHKSGKPLGDFHNGQAVSGTVTNVLHERVWMDIGAEKDASFWQKEGGKYKVGDHVEGVKISSVDVKKGRIVVEAPAAQA